MNKDKVIEFAKDKYSDKSFRYHILPVVNNALMLGKELGADLEVIEIASYLHDIGRTMGSDEFQANNDHAIIGAAECPKILKEFGYSDDFISKVQHCVLCHRGKKDPKPESVEAQIVACADAMAHFDTFLDLFTHFLEKDNSFEETVLRIEKKMQRNWDIKLTLPEAREIAKPKYDAIMLLLGSMKNSFE